MKSLLAAGLCLLFWGGRGVAQTSGIAGGTLAVDAAEYTGHDENGIPRYTTRSFTSEERSLLRTTYGIEDPSRLYVSDSTAERVLKYDTGRKRCRGCYVNSYRVGFVSMRRPGESWEQLEHRIAAMSPAALPPNARVEDRSTEDLDPAIRGDVERMLAAAARSGFVFHVTATYRSPEREALLMRRRNGSTHTLTSLHAYGRAIDIVVGDGNPRRPRTRARWAAFRRWLTAYHAGEFRVLGSPDPTWDWPHVEIPAASIGFRDIDAALARARECQAWPERTPCDFEPWRPEHR
jgi:hypothetical protein